MYHTEPNCTSTTATFHGLEMDRGSSLCHLALSYHLAALAATFHRWGNAEVEQQVQDEGEGEQLQQEEEQLQEEQQHQQEQQQDQQGFFPVTL